MRLKLSAKCLLTLVLVVLCQAKTGLAQEWTRFRGPNGTGESEANIPAQWEGKQIRWKTPLPGVGHASPVIWGNKVFTISADDQKKVGNFKPATRYVLCLDATTGKELWRQEYAGQAHPIHARSSFATSTPTVDAEQVYSAWSDPDHTVLVAHSHSGKENWKIDLGPWVSQHGFGTSPILYGDLVILTCSQENEKRAEGSTAKESFIVGVNKNTGKIVWRTERQLDTASFSVPCLHKTPAGKDELVMLSTAEGFFALDPITGKQNWAQTAFKMRTVSSPVLIGGLIIGTTGSGGGGNYVSALRPGPNPEVVYEIKKEAPYVPTPIAHGDLLFLWSDKGIVTCVTATDGKQVWQHRVPAPGFSGSPVRAGNKLFCVDEAGVVVCLGAGREFVELGKTDLQEECRSTPAIANGHIFVRTVSHLICAGGK